MVPLLPRCRFLGAAAGGGAGARGGHWDAGPGGGRAREACERPLRLRAHSGGRQERGPPPKIRSTFLTTSEKQKKHELLVDPTLLICFGQHLSKGALTPPHPPLFSLFFSPPNSVWRQDHYHQKVASLSAKMGKTDSSVAQAAEDARLVIEFVHEFAVPETS